MTIHYRQYFCTVDEVLADLKNQPFALARLFAAIRDGSDWLADELGDFIPVTRTVKKRGSGTARLFTPPLLSLTSVLNLDVALSDVDYLLFPNGRHWDDGPYTWLEADPDSDLLAAWDNTEPDSVQLTGQWGKFDRRAATGATVQDASGQTVSAETVTVESGALLSPGMILRIEDEQELVTGLGTPANATTLNGAIDGSVEVITFADGSLVQTGEVLRCEFERMKLLEVQTNQGAVLRGFDGTARGSHATGKAVGVFRTYTVERAVNGTVAAAHAHGAAIERYVVPPRINYLARETAILQYNKAATGYSGKSGNADSGETYYYSSRPQVDLAEAKKAFSTGGQF